MHQKLRAAILFMYFGYTVQIHCSNLWIQIVFTVKNPVSSNIFEEVVLNQVPIMK